MTNDALFFSERYGYKKFIKLPLSWRMGILKRGNLWMKWICEIH